MKKKDRIINNLREMMTANAAGESGGFTSSADAKGPVAGFDPLLHFRRKKNGTVDRRSATPDQRRWLKAVKEIINN